MGTLRLLARAEFRIPRELHAPGPFEAVIAALVELQLRVFEMQDLLGHAVQEIALVTDDEHGAAVAPQVLLQPQGGLEIEVVGRLVEQQQIGASKQESRQHDPHAPATRERVERALLGRVIEPEPVQDAGRPGRRAVRLLVLQAFVNLDDPRVIRRGGGLALQGGELVVGREHGFDRVP